MAAYPTYDSYKESGIDWIGQIPTSWDQVANKQLFRLRKVIEDRPRFQAGQKQLDFGHFGSLPEG